jgi:hypothetical protein
MHFGSPPGGILINRAAEVRIQALEFPRGKPILTKEELRATTEERYEKLPDGGYLVKTTLLEAVATHNGVPIPEQVSQVGVTLVHRVDANGRYLDLENGLDAIDELKKRLSAPGLRQLAEPLLTPEALSGPLAHAWQARFAPFCGKQMQPGQELFTVDEQPVGEVGTVRTIGSERILGTTNVGERNALDIDVEYGGRDSEVARSPAANDALLGFAEGLNALTTNVRGTGRILIDPETCQTFSTEADIRGEGRLNDQATKDSGVQLPLRVKYEVHRQVLRMTPSEAEAQGIPTIVQQPSQPQPAP